MMARAFLATVMIALLPFPALADIIPGPIPADVVRVIDGDTFEADVHPWPGMTIRTRIRPDSFDTPEMKGKCPEETALAIKARDRFKALTCSRRWPSLC